MRDEVTSCAAAAAAAASVIAVMTRGVARALNERCSVQSGASRLADALDR